MTLKLSRRPPAVPLLRTSLYLGGSDGAWLCDEALNTATQLPADTRLVVVALKQAREPLLAEQVCAVTELSRVRAHAAVEPLVLANAFEGPRTLAQLSMDKSPLSLAGLALSHAELEAIQTAQQAAYAAETLEDALKALVSPVLEALEAKELAFEKSERFMRRAAFSLPGAPEGDQMARFAAALARVFEALESSHAQRIEALFQGELEADFVRERIAEVSVNCQGLRPDVVVQTAASVFMLITEATALPTALSEAQLAELFVHDLGALLGLNGPRPWPQWLRELAGAPRTLPLIHLTSA